MSRRDGLWVSVSRYAALYGLTRNTVYKLLDARLLETYRITHGRTTPLIRIKNLPPDRHSLPTEPFTT